MSEHWTEVVGVNTGIATIPLFGINIPSSSKGIWLCSEFSGAEADYQIKLG